jgi:RNA polymerase sigma-70 factor, ECF subfamily
VPPNHLLPDRLEAVLAVVYLIFNEGWGGGRVDLSSEAIRLGRALVELMPDEAEAVGLLALMLLNDARREARFHKGQVVLLDEQDRDLWNQQHIVEGRAIASLYGALAELTQSPVVELNRAVAIAEIDGPEAALALVDQLALSNYRYFHSTRANLLRRLGRNDEARNEYSLALELTPTESERQFLAERIEELEDAQ